MTEPRAYRVRIEAAGPAASRIADALDEGQAEPLSISYFDIGNEMFEVSALYGEPPDEEALTALLEHAGHGEPVSKLAVEAVPDADWVTLSQGQRGPVRAGRFLVHGSHDRDTIVRNRFTLEIDAAQAFGTAHHPTTQLCLQMLDRLAKRGRPDLVLDLGTGTGILALAAALAFDRPVIGTDNDSVAVEIARDNAKKAGLALAIHVFEADGLAHPMFNRIAPDLIMANILAGPLYGMAPAMAKTLQPGGYVLLSGLTAGQTRAIAARYGAVGFALEERTVLDGWGALLMGLRKGRPLFG